MGDTLVVLALLFSLVQGMVSFQQAAVPVAKESAGLINGSFEEPLGGVPKAAVGRDGAVAYHGSYSLKLSGDGTGMASQVMRSGRTFEGRVTLSGWVRAEGVTGAVDENHAVKLQVVSATGGGSSQLYLPLPVGTYDWQPWSYTVDLPPGDTYWVAVYPLFGATHTGTVWHDALGAED